MVFFIFVTRKLNCAEIVSLRRYRPDRLISPLGIITLNRITCISWPGGSAGGAEIGRRTLRTGDVNSAGPFARPHDTLLDSVLADGN